MKPIAFCKPKPGFIDGHYLEWAGHGDLCHNCGESRWDHYPANIHEALKKARMEGKINCDKLEFYDDWKSLPLEIRDKIGGPLGPGLEYYVVAWRGNSWQMEALAPQLLEQVDLAMIAGVLCGDLNVGLDRQCL